MVRLREEIHDLGEALLNLAPDGHMVVPGTILFLLGVGKIRGNDVGPPVIFFSLDVDDVRGDSR